MAFQAERVKEAVYPEIFGIGSYVVAELVGAAVDSRLKWMNGYPVFQTGITAVALMGGLAMVGYDKAPGFSKGLVYGSGVGLIVNLVSGLYQAATKQPAKLKLSDVAALVPRRVGALPAGGGGSLKLPPGVKIVPITSQEGVAVSERGTFPYGS